MANVRIIPFKAEHVDCLDMREIEAKMHIGFDTFKEAEKSCVAVTGLLDGRIMLCGGIRPFLDYTAEIWLLPSVYLASAPVTVGKRVRRWLFDTRKDMSLKRLQTCCIDDAFHARWMVYLGFEKEGVLRRYNFGMDYGIWGRIWG